MTDPWAPLHDSWARYQSSRVQSTTSAEKYHYENIFAKGYFLTNGAIVDILPPMWRRVQLLDGYALAVAPDLPYSYVESPETHCATLVLGHAFHMERESVDTGHTAIDLHSDLVTDRGFAQFEDSVLKTSGRFLAVAIKAKELRVYTDPMASLTCFWAQKGRWRPSVFLASHSSLIAQATDQADSTQKNWIMSHPDYKSPMGKTLPALITPHDSAREVFANCHLSIRNGVVSHQRYFPKHSLEPMSVAEATDIFIEEMRFNTRAWLGVADHAYLALTAGQDSRAVLSSALDLFHDAREKVTLMTYHFFDRATDSTAKDVLKANEMALDADLPFKLVNIGTVAKEMAPLYKTTFPTWARFPTLASALYTQLRADSSLFIGIGGGIGTTFFTKREDKVISPELLAQKYANSDVSSDPILIDHFRAYIEYTEFNDEKFHGYDFYDLFHWEHRLTKWAGASYAEYGLAATVALPFNSRRLILAMLSLPFEQRLDKDLYAEIVKRSSIK